MTLTQSLQSSEATIETEKRLKLLNDFVNEIKSDVIGVILAGSLAYAPYEKVRKDSDIDLIVVYDDIKKSAKDYFDEYKYLENESYDGYLAKRHENLGHVPDIRSKNKDLIDISLHNINYSALQKISYGNYETLAYYRQKSKDATYYSKDFDGQNFPFQPERREILIKLENKEIKGERRIDSIAFQSPNGNYVLGNDMDKLLSGSKIILDTDNKLNHIMEQIWLNSAKRLIEHRQKYGQKIDIYNEDIGPLLYRYERFSDKTKKDIKNKTINGIRSALGVVDIQRPILDLSKIRNGR